MRRFTKRQMARLSEVREVLEGLSARLPASRIDPEEVDRLAETFRRLDLTPTPEAARRYIEADRYFHWRLVETAGNEPLAAAIESVNIMIFAYLIPFCAWLLMGYLRTIPASSRSARRSTAGFAGTQGPSPWSMPASSCTTATWSCTSLGRTCGTRLRT